MTGHRPLSVRRSASLHPVAAGVVGAAVLLAAACAEGAQTWHVQPGGRGTGASPADALGSLEAAVKAARAGDTILLGPGTYEGVMTSARGGTPDAPITITGTPTAPPVLTHPGRVATLSHPYIVLQHVILDGQFGPGDTVRIGSAADGLVLRHVEVRRSGRDCIDMGAPSDVRIEDSLVHHCLDATNGRTDAHGVVAAGAQRLTIRNTEIHTFSGDAVQLDPSRSSPGWSGLRIEGCRFWLQPLPAATNGFAAGVVPGENALDTKTPPDGARSDVVVTDTDVWGFENGRISNMAAFNLKERVDAVIDRVTVHHSLIAFRVRGPRDGGASVTIRNTVVHHVATAVRYEDDIASLHLNHVTLGRNVGRLFQRASSPLTRPDVSNLLVLGAALPRVARGAGLAVEPRAFRDAAHDDYRLADDSPAIDRASPSPDAGTDRRGVRRPRGPRADVGAYEHCPEPCGPDAARLRPGR